MNRDDLTGRRLSLLIPTTEYKHTQPTRSPAFQLSPHLARPPSPPAPMAAAAAAAPRPVTASSCATKSLPALQTPPTAALKRPAPQGQQGQWAQQGEDGGAKRPRLSQGQEAVGQALAAVAAAAAMDRCVVVCLCVYEARGTRAY